MRVKSIVLDGFKSYAHRQELADLDKHFNAITGFNGSGKSNVFDAICFVMGISNLKKVRADDTRDLIYRAGAAGVQSARVTIEFINDDPKTAPAGYPPSEYPIISIGRQTQLGGKQRYFFLNRQSDQAKIKHFFQNIHLNVDNPHFMVLQGTVHKLIGMKSSDILALVEEAVGTKVFDIRRRSSENLIRSKERKLEDINRNLTQEIGPMLEAMKADQVEYDQFLKASELLEGKRRFRVAFQYWGTSEQLQANRDRKAVAEEESAACKATLLRQPGLEEAQAKLVSSIQAKLREPEEAYAKLHDEEVEAKKELQRAGVQLQACDKTLQELQKQQKAFLTEKAELAKRQLALKKLADHRAALTQEATACSDVIDATKESLRLHRSGVTAGMNGVSLEEERTQVDHHLIRTRGELKRVEEKLLELEHVCEELRTRVKAEALKAQSLHQLVETTKRRLQAAQQAYQPYEEADKRLRQVSTELSTMQKKHLHLQTEIEQSADPTLPLSFHHDHIPSHPDIDQHIYGRLGQLITPSDPKYSVALSVGAQQHLMKLVIRDDDIAQALVDQGRLRQRTSFLPMNKIVPPRVDQKRFEEAMRRAKELNGMAVVAKDLVRTDAKFAGVVDMTFGGFVVCSDLRLAKIIAFDPKIAVKAVTLDGQTADPAGLMSGGSINDSVDLLSRIRAQSSRLQPVTEMQESIRLLEVERQQLATRLGKGGAAKKELEDAEDALQRVESQFTAVTGGSSQQLQRAEQDLANLTAQLPELRRKETDLQNRKVDLDERATASVDPKKLEKELEAKLKESTDRLATLRKQLDAGANEFDQKEADVEQRDAEITARGGELQRELDAQQQSREAIVATQQHVEQKVQSVLQRRKQSDARRIELEKELEDAELGLRSLRDRQDGLDRTIKERDLEVRSLNKLIEDQKKSLTDMERRYHWLMEERSSFGQLNGPFPFHNQELTKQMLAELEEAEALSEKMSRRVNKKSSVVYESIHKEYTELLEKRTTLDEDRQALMEVIEQVEQRKWAALDKMVTVVSNVFSMLFNSCLPGATAKLIEERSERGHICGLQVKVSFNGKEKESLSELSGGQRSLLALCLILSILRLKPAPIYILDEVDAALDPSHTQNIGRMLQQHFSNSQFLLVSLKDGMFNHANVLYEVRNTQGFSEISRREAKK